MGLLDRVNQANQQRSPTAGPVAAPVAAAPTSVAAVPTSVAATPTAAVVPVSTRGRRSENKEGGGSKRHGASDAECGQCVAHDGQLH